jgi:preprotein translocase subunit SecF
VNLFPYDSKFDFMRLRRVSIGMAIALLVVAIGGLATRGLNFALDFTGGTVVELKFEKEVDVPALREHLETAGFESAVVQSIGTSKDIVVRLKPSESRSDATKTGDAVVDAAQLPGNTAKLTRSDFVGPQVGKELASQGVWAVIFVAIAFLVYISVRFEKKFAAAAILATVHDVVICVGYFAITGKEFDLNVLAGILSVMGYSINDTIVVFDRVRENFRSLHRIEPYEVLNRSVNQTLSRTIITSFVALLTVLALYFFGGSALKGMAESQIIGIVIGTLSSIFVACPLLLILGTTRVDLLPRAKDDSDLARRP